MKGAEVEVEVNTLLLAGGSILGAFLYHPDPDGRAETEAELYREGAQFIVHPHVEDPARIGGTAIIADSTLMITVGSRYVISPLEVPVDAAKRAKRVAVFCLREPFQAGDRTEKTVLAASLPLDVLERRTDT